MKKALDYVSDYPRIPENPFIGAKISYASRVIANFVQHFIAMATGVNRGKYKCHR